MPSSTSSSEFENTYQTLNHSGALKVSLKALCGALVLFALVIALYK